MKTTTKILSLTLSLILGFSQLALSNNKSLKNVEQAMSEDSIKSISKSQKHSPVQPSENGSIGQQSVFDQMTISSDDILEIKLTTDVQNLIVNKNTDDYQVAYLEMKDATGNLVNHKLKVKPRGKYRRKICDFPPLKLNFSKDELTKRGLHPEFDKLKLVTHCTDNKMEGKDNVLREYLTYQIYNTLSDNSFRTQLVKIEYTDLHNSSKSITRYGFLIEDKDEMATRLNGEICDCRGLTSDVISDSQYNVMTMFQYMIGNEDWDLAAIRNIKAVQSFSGGKENNIIVPYDFDFSGVVDAPYAKPNTKFNHLTVKERHFSGTFNNAQELEITSNHFLSKRKEILQTVRKFKRLSADSRIDIEKYLEEFFTTLKNENQVADIFLHKGSPDLIENIAK